MRAGIACMYVFIVSPNGVLLKMVKSSMWCGEGVCFFAEQSSQLLGALQYHTVMKSPLVSTMQ